MLGIVCPDLYVSSIWLVDLSILAARGIRGIIFDIDNTIVNWGSRDVSDAVLEWLGRAKASGFRLCVLSNNLKSRIDEVSRILGVPAARGLKPARSAFRSALAVLGTTPGETAVIGDQLFTDVLGGNLTGMYTVLVRPMSSAEFATTRILRVLERAVISRLASKGMLSFPDGIR